jgi:hypothetical protein
VEMPQGMERDELALRILLTGGFKSTRRCPTFPPIPGRTRDQSGAGKAAGSFAPLCAPSPNRSC